MEFVDEDCTVTGTEVHLEVIDPQEACPMGVLGGQSVFLGQGGPEGAHVQELYRSKAVTGPSAWHSNRVEDVLWPGEIRSGS